jgi:hypothetical protein
MAVDADTENGFGCHAGILVAGPDRGRSAVAAIRAVRLSSSFVSGLRRNIAPLQSTSAEVSILTICSRNAEALAIRASAFWRAASYCGKSLSIAAMFNACLPFCSAKLSSLLSLLRVCESVTAMWFSLSASCSLHPWKSTEVICIS